MRPCLCGTARSLPALVAWRLLQGAGGAALLSTAQATLRQVFPREEQGMVQSIFLLGVIVAPTLGPTLGGWITDNASWHWCFFINLPIGIASAFLVDVPARPAESGPAIGPVDWPGITLLIVGVGSLQYVLEEGNADWFESQLLVDLSIAAGVALAALGVVATLVPQPAPGDPVPRATQPRSRRVDFLFVVLGFGLVRRRADLPAVHADHSRVLTDRDGVGDDARRSRHRRDGAGVRPPARAATGRTVDPRLLILTGMGLMLTAMWTLGHLSTAAGESDARYALIIRGLALGLLFTPINNAAFGNLKPAEAQQASGLINLARQLGGSFGIAVLGAYLTRHIAYHRADLAVNFSAGNPLFQERYQAIVSGLAAQGASLVEAQQRALAVLDGTLMRQASMRAYNDAWLLLLVSFICVLPAVFLLKRPKPRPAVTADAH